MLIFVITSFKEGYDGTFDELSDDTVDEELLEELLLVELPELFNDESDDMPGMVDDPAEFDGLPVLHADKANSGNIATKIKAFLFI